VSFLQHYIASNALKGMLMNLEKFTDRAKGFLQSAQTVAIRMNHQRISPEHLLKALLEDEQGMASGLIKAAGGDAATALRETDAALAKVPAVSGSGAQQTPGLDNDAVRVLDSAEQVAQKAGDSFVTVERLLLALTLATTTTAGKALATAGVRAEAAPPTRRARKTVMMRSRNSPAT
jgi:ATP-dependent Clp protease ATP-binding subunit ClpB